MTKPHVSGLSGADVIGDALSQAPAFANLPASSQREVRDSLGKIARFLAQPVGPARQLAPDLSALRTGGNAPSPTAPAPTSGAAPAPAAGSPAPASGGTSATGRVGDVARTTLNAIDFPSFVASLIQGTFQAIVDASIQQMEAYAELLKNAALTVDEFMTDNVTDGTARDYLADRFEGMFERDTTGTSPQLRVRAGAQQTELPSFFKELGIEVPADVDEQTVEESVVPATRRMLAERRQQTLATMVLMGINRVVVTDGEISAKLTFHVDASETASMRFDQQKTSGMNMSGTAGRNPFSANGIMVNTTSLNTQSDINVRADLVGNVVVRFRSETFPLERFADSAAIQLINTRAKVPTAPQPAAAPGAAQPAPGAPPPAAALPPATPPPATPPPAPAAQAPAVAPRAQSLFGDPWAPEA
jgi:hypothetical protein